MRWRGSAARSGQFNAGTLRTVGRPISVRLGDGVRAVMALATAHELVVDLEQKALAEASAGLISGGRR